MIRGLTEREGETGKKGKTTPDVGGKSVSEKSQVTCNHPVPGYFVRVVKDKRTRKNGGVGVSFPLTKIIRGNDGVGKYELSVSEAVYCIYNGLRGQNGSCTSRGD